MRKGPRGEKRPADVIGAAQLSSCGDLSKISYYIGRETIVPTERIPGMWVWREGLYAFMCKRISKPQRSVSGYRGRFATGQRGQSDKVTGV
jgi:hypothetical protein